VEELVREAVGRLGGGDLQRAAELTFGTPHGMRGDPAPVRRRRAADVYGVTVERFRHAQERTIVEQVATAVEALLAEGATAEQQPAARMPDLPASPPSASGPDAPGEGRWTRGLSAGGTDYRVTLHVGAVELLRDVDVVVASGNRYLQVSHTFGSSLLAALRVAAARWAPSGEMEDDIVLRELTDWSRVNRRQGVQVAAGTIAVTSAGELRRRGIHLIFHAAAMTPEGGRYTLSQTNLCRTVSNVFTRLGERDDRLPTGRARSVCLPLFGAGSGAVSRRQSMSWLWNCLREELPQVDPVDVVLITRGGQGLDLSDWDRVED
jgi:O-acetyl-ADP-ribose deacetylase (regulator of RNase III)